MCNVGSIVIKRWHIRYSNMKWIPQFLWIVLFKFPLCLYSLWFIASDLLLFTQPSLPISQHPLWLSMLVPGGCQAKGRNSSSLGGGVCGDAPLPPLPLCPGCSSHHLSTRGCILPGYTWLMWSQRIAPAVWLLSLEKKKKNDSTWRGRGWRAARELCERVQSCSCSDSTLWRTT